MTIREDYTSAEAVAVDPAGFQEQVSKVASYAII